MPELWHNFQTHDIESRDLLTRIIAASQTELLEQGVMGFRTQRVARSAKCNVSAIYRFYIDRTDLIVSVLGDVFRNLLFDYFAMANELLQREDSITPEFIVDLVPDLDNVEHSDNMRLWLMAITLSTESEKLRNAIVSAIEEHTALWPQFFESVNAKLEPGWSLNMPTYHMILRMHFLYYNSLFGAQRIDDKSYKAFLFQQLTGQQL